LIGCESYFRFDATAALALEPNTSFILCAKLIGLAGYGKKLREKETNLRLSDNIWKGRADWIGPFVTYICHKGEIPEAHKTFRFPYTIYHRKTAIPKTCDIDSEGHHISFSKT